MSNGLENVILDMMDTTPETEDYKGEDGLLYCGKCHKPKEAYFPQGRALFGRDRHPSECDCRRAEREKRETEELEKKHSDEVDRLKRNGFTDPAMRDWTFGNDNGNCPQIEKEGEGEKGTPAHAAYGRFHNVFLSDTELDGLKSELPGKWEYYIDRLSAHIASSGKQYRNHAATIYKWAQEDAGKVAPKKGIPDYSYNEEDSL